MLTRAFTVSIIAAVALASDVRAAPPPHLAAARVTQSPTLDGRLDDAAWDTAPAATVFVQKFPNERAAASEPTTLRVVYDRDAIWIGVDCTQRTAPIVRRHTRRDRPIESDSITIDLDTRGDGTSAFEFSVNAAGVLSDAIRFNDTDLASEWDENWDARVALTDHGWSAELRIPLRVLRYDKAPVQAWGLQARRYTSARQEIDEWSFIARDDAGEVSRYGRLDALRGLRAPSPFELRLFALGFVRHRDAAGSTLFLVYTRSQAPDLTLMTGQSPSLDLGAIRRGPAADVLLLKLTYWWS